MDQTKALREQLQKILTWEDAHVGFDEAVAGVPSPLRGTAPPGQPHSLWQLLEHMRLTQWDILDFCVNPAYVGLSMEEHWPPSAAPPADAAWGESIAGFRRDREAMKRLAMDSRIDLFGRIPQGTGQTYLRAVLLLADHNAYHVAQVVVARRGLGIWPPAKA
jgi:uncharacterized damage-inducible protein DinB